MNPSKQTRRVTKSLENSKFGEFNATLESRKEGYHYAKIEMECCNYEFHKRLIEAVQPILDELTVEMNNMIFGDDEDGD